MRRAAAFIVLRRESDKAPQYAVDNRAARGVKVCPAFISLVPWSLSLMVCFAQVWQDGSNHLDLGLKAAPSTRAAVAWDRPHGPRVLVVAQEGSQELVKVPPTRPPLPQDSASRACGRDAAACACERGSCQSLSGSAHACRSGADGRVREGGSAGAQRGAPRGRGGGEHTGAAGA